MVLAPEHSLAKSLATDETREAVEKYIFDASMKSNVDRLQDKEKTGVFTGSYAVNPLNGAKTPIWLSDYVLADYGTVSYTHLSGEKQKGADKQQVLYRLRGMHSGMSASCEAGTLRSAGFITAL